MRIKLRTRASVFTQPSRARYISPLLFTGVAASQNAAGTAHRNGGTTCDTWYPQAHAKDFIGLHMAGE